MVPVIDRGAPLGEVFEGVVDAVLKAERRLSRRLVRDLCAAQFLPDLAGSAEVRVHPLAAVLIDAVADRVPNIDATQLVRVFLTAMFVAANPLRGNSRTVSSNRADRVASRWASRRLTVGRRSLRTACDLPTTSKLTRVSDARW